MGREWGKRRREFHVCFSAAQCWLGTVAEQGSAWTASILYIYSICGQYCLVFCGLVSAAHRNEPKPESNEEQILRANLTRLIVPCQSAQTGKPVSTAQCK